MDCVFRVIFFRFSLVVTRMSNAAIEFSSNRYKFVFILRFQRVRHRKRKSLAQINQRKCKKKTR